MLECVYGSPTRLRQLRRGPLGAQMDGLAADLRRQGYAPQTAQSILNVASSFSLYARVCGVADAGQFDEALADRFLKEELAEQGSFKGAQNATRHVLRYLRQKGIIPAVVEEAAPEPFGELLAVYDGHLRDARGLVASTRDGYLHGARRLLAWFQGRHGERPLSALEGRDVLEFITENAARGHSAEWCRGLCGETRIFLRYLHGEGILATDLSRTVPRVRRWRLSSVPKHLPWQEVRRLIDSVDVTHPDGMRDKAILLLLAVLGLRNIEVRLLEFSHIHWRAGELHLPRTKTRRERVLPLPQEVGTALADYVLHGRPPLDVPYVFLRHRGPVGPFASSGGVGGIVYRHLKDAGIDAPTRGSHLLRHSLATHMVNTGVPIKDIADVLGHGSIDTTAIYTKVDLRTLSQVALPFPGGTEA